LLAGLLCLLLMGFTGAANAVIRWDVFPSPSEVINSGRSEVLGGITFVVAQNNSPIPVTTGNIAGGPSQIGILFQNRVQIDNAMTTGIRVYTNNVALASTVAVCNASCNPAQMWVTAQNIDSTGGGVYSGYLTLNIPGGISMAVGDAIHIDGVRGRIDRSDLAAAGSDGYAQAQSINDPASNQFFPEQFRVAKSYIPMTVVVATDVATLCFPTYGGSANTTRLNFASAGTSTTANFLTRQKITVTEVFPRAFIAKDSLQNSVADSSDRTDSYPTPSTGWLGSPTQGTQLKIYLNSIPATVLRIDWPALVTSNTGGGLFQATTMTSFTAGTVGGPANGSGYMVYEYITSNQTGASDITTEGFDFQPALALSATNQQDATSAIVRAGVSLWPPPLDVQAASVLYQPFTASLPTPTQTATVPAMPRFVTNYLSGSYAYTDPLSAGALANFGVYETFAPCVCYLLYPYTTKDSFWDTGVVVANTSDDTGAFAAGTGASRQAGRVTFWLYDFRLGAITPTAGIFFADAAHTAPLNQTGPAFDTNTPAQPIYYAGQSVRGLVSNLVTGAAATALANRGYTDFAGYIIAKAEFQYCHCYAFIADRTFANIAQGYIAGMIPDPSVKGVSRQAADAGDITNLKAGEGINN